MSSREPFQRAVPAATLVGGPHRRVSLGLVCAGILILGWLLFGWQVAERGLWSAHEGRAAQNAQNILDTGNWLIPTLYIGEPDLQKPPLYYWLVALPGWLTGQPVGPLAVRLPSTLAAVAVLIVVFDLGRRLGGAQAGILAVIILASTTRFAWLARVGRIDMPLTLCCVAAFWIFWRANEEAKADPSSSRRLPWSFFVVLAIGVLFKGPVALVLASLPIATFLFFLGEPVVPLLQENWRQSWSRLRVLPGLALVLALTVPWYVQVIVQTNGDYFWEFFVRHNVDRALGTDEGLKAGPIWFYIPRLLADTFPWSLLFPALAIGLARRSQTWRKPQDSSGRATLFLICWIISQWVFLSLVRFKRGDYLLPIDPALALLLGTWLVDRQRRFIERLAVRPVRHPRRRSRAITASAALLAIVTAPLFLWGALQFRKKGMVRAIFENPLGDHYFNGTDRFMLDHLEELLRENWPFLAIIGVVIVGCVGLLQTGWQDRKNMRIAASFALPWLVCYLFQIHLLLPAIDPIREMSRFAEEIRVLAGREATIYYFGKFDADLVFHVGKPARMVKDWDQLAELALGADPCFVVLKSDLFEAVSGHPRTQRFSAILDNRRAAFGEHREARILVTNHPARVADRLPVTRY